MPELTMRAVDAVATGAVDVVRSIGAACPLQRFDEAMRAAVGGATFKTPLIP